MNQRELHADTHSFPNALRAVLREDPDVVLVGEMRDLETIECALRIAETGHLTFATLHTNSAVQTMNRIIDVFPAQPAAAGARAAVVRPRGHPLPEPPPPRRPARARCMAMEILVPTPAIRNLIREDKLHQIYSMMQTGQNKYGMQTFNQSLATLVHRRVISQELAMTISSLPDELAEMIARGAGVVTTTAAGGDAAAGARERRAARLMPGGRPMAQFVWKGRTRQGATTGGVLVADSKDLAIADLRRRQIDVTTVKEKGKEFAVPKIGARQGQRPKRLAIFTRQFSVMIDAGLPLVQCLEILGNQQDNRLFQKIILAVRQDVEAGSSLAEAMRKHPKAFDDLFVNMVAAGEAGGILDTILRRLSTYIEKAVKLKGQVKTALIYPVSVLIGRRDRRLHHPLEGHPDVRRRCSRPSAPSSRSRRGSSSRPRTSSRATSSSSSRASSRSGTPSSATTRRTAAGASSTASSSSCRSSATS